MTVEQNDFDYSANEAFVREQFPLLSVLSYHSGNELQKEAYDLLAMAKNLRAKSLSRAPAPPLGEPIAFMVTWDRVDRFYCMHRKDADRMKAELDDNGWMNAEVVPLYAALAAAPQSPIVKVDVVDGKIALAEFYTPGLPDGKHDLFCEPAAPQALPSAVCLNCGERINWSDQPSQTKLGAP